MRVNIIVLILLLFVSCTKQNSLKENQSDTIKEVMEIKQTEDSFQEKLSFIDILREKPMEIVMTETYNYGIPIRVYEEEKGYYLGFIGFETTGEIYSGYDGGAPLDFLLDSIEYQNDKLIIIMKRVSVYLDEKTGEKIYKHPGLIQVVITKETYLSVLDGYINNTDKRAIEAVGTIIQPPIFD